MWAPDARPSPLDAAAPESVDAAVIDVGSNSVRLVMYRMEGRAIWTIFNEKVLAGLGRDLSATGLLSRPGVEIALPALKRFRALIEASDIQNLFVVATAAVREARDGPDFLARVKNDCGLTVRVLTGEEEARYSALGVVAGRPDAEGVVGDLGGSSLELVRISGGRPTKGVTLALGPLALGAPAAFEPNRIGPIIEQRLAAAEGFASSTFHAVGGAWRNLALLHMRMAGYPLEIIHEYEISAKDAIEAAGFVSRLSKSSLDRVSGGFKKRAETLPHAAAVLEALLSRLGAEKVIFSAYGIREGLLFDAMPAEDQARDPLIEGAAALGGRRAEAETLGAALAAWATPALGTLPPLFGDRDPVLLAAGCRLADLGARLHPDHRADLVFEQVLRGPIPGMGHAERAFLAHMIFSRYTSATTPPEPGVISRLLGSDAQRRARLYGAAVRLGCDLSGKSPALLAASSLRLDAGRLILWAEKSKADMLLGGQTRKRAQTLAGLLGAKLEIEAG